MRYFKAITDGIIQTIGVGTCGTEITEAEYNTILSALDERPKRPGYGYLLREDLSWEEYEIEPDEPQQPDSDELLDILLGGGS